MINEDGDKLLRQRNTTTSTTKAHAISDQANDNATTRAKKEIDEEAEATTITNTTIATTSTSTPFTIENACWFLASIVCVYFSDIFNIILYDERIYRTLMLSSFSLIGVFILIAAYMVLWLSYVKKVNSDQWSDTTHPALIPVATACFVSGSIL
jgi:uncharacterized membrane protein